MLPRTVLPERSTAFVPTQSATPFASFAQDINYGVGPDVGVAPPKPAPRLGGAGGTFDEPRVTPRGAGGSWEPNTRARDGREYPPIPETASREYLRAIAREVLKENFPGVPAGHVMRDKEMYPEFERLLTARYWRSDASR